MILKFGQDVALRGTEKLVLFFPEKVRRRGASHFLYEKSRFLQKNQFFV